MKKTQFFAVIGFLLGWGAPVGALFIRLWMSHPISELYGSIAREWDQNAFFYWYMLSGTCLVLSFTGYLLGRISDH